MQYDAVIGPPVLHPDLSMQEIWIRYIILQLGGKVFPKEWVPGLIVFFRGISAARIPAASHLPSGHMRHLLFEGVRPSNLKYSQENDSLKPGLNTRSKHKSLNPGAIPNSPDTRNAINRTLVQRSTHQPI